jgi:hypothetical protein
VPWPARPSRPRRPAPGLERPRLRVHLETKSGPDRHVPRRAIAPIGRDFVIDSTNPEISLAPEM